MVVLASAILSKTGHVLVSRQFVSIARTRIEGLLVAFPKLIGTESQHTFVETESVRYVYQPLEQLYLVLITNKQSNIMEDLETLKLLSKIIPEYAEGYTEASIKTAAFDLIFAFDEVLTLGHKEPITLQQVKTFLEMDSHEERLFNIIQASKMDEAKEAMRRKAEQIAREKEELRNQTSLPRAGGSYSSYSSSYSSSSSIGHRGSTDDEEEDEPGKIEEEPAPKPTPKASSTKATAGGGPQRMVLGKAKKTEDEFVAALVQEDKLVVSPRTSSGIKVDEDKDEETATAVAEHNQPVAITIDEKLTLTLDREGGVKQLELSGEMKLAIYDPDWTKIVVSTNGPLKKSEGYRCRLHPKINDKLYDSKGILGLKEAGRGFPSGSDNAPIILRWKLQSKDEKYLPFTINFWPNSEDGKSMVNVQVEHQKEGVTFKNVHLSIPCPSKEPPEVGDHEGDFIYDSKKKTLIWTIPELSSDNSKASLDFSVPEMEGDSFYPISIRFTSDDTYSGVEVQKVKLVDGDKTTEFDQVSNLTVDKFTME